jgi:hypothetical protein
MRQVFTSPRLPNVEGVAKMLQDAGIEVRITGGRSYKSAWTGRRTYRDPEDGGSHPAVWVLKSEDQPRARQMLREAGMLGTTNQTSDSYLAPSVHDDLGARAPAPERRAWRLKIWVLVAIAAVLALAFGAMRKPRPVPPARPAAVQVPAVPTPTPTPMPLPAPVVKPQTYRAETPPALALMLVSAELETRQARIACVLVDGQPDPVLSAQLQRKGLTINPASGCARAQGSQPVLRIDVTGYATDGSGTGTVETVVTARDTAGNSRIQRRTFEVQREGLDWSVLRELPARD